MNSFFFATLTTSRVSTSTSGGGGGGATYSDDFNRANEFPMTSPWLSAPGDFTDMYLLSNKLLSSGGNSAARLDESAATFSANQYVELAIGSDLVNSGPMARMDSNGNCYFVYYFNNAGTGELRIFKSTANGATLTQLGSSIVLGAYPTLVSTDLLGIQTTGSGTTVIEVFINSVSQGSVNDSSTPHLSGQPGILQFGVANGDNFFAEDV